MAGPNIGEDQPGDSSGVVLDVAFPEPHYLPMVLFCEPGHSLVALPVSFDLLYPVLRVGSLEFPPSMNRTPVPKTSVNEHSDLLLRENNVGQNPWGNTTLKSVSSPQSMQSATEDKFRRRVLPTTTAEPGAVFG